MIARAPGKLVLSGAYAVLEGAPALVAAIDRYAVADASRPALRITPEVREALFRRGALSADATDSVDGRVAARTAAPWFDATALRDEVGGRKLGLGSSAAILVASLAALELAIDPDSSDDELARRVLPSALAAHRAAQGGGSGIDVAASALGGVLRFERPNLHEDPRVERVTLPEPLFIQVWSSRDSASTADMIARVARLHESRPGDHRRLMGLLSGAARAAATASDGVSFLEACGEQLALLTELGDLAQAPIVTPEMRAFGKRLAERALVLPSGAGGGDIVLCIGTEPLGIEIETAGTELGFVPLSVSLGARGVHAASRPWQDVERTAAVP
jgi:phosphomevalonate kinase